MAKRIVGFKWNFGNGTQAIYLWDCENSREFNYQRNSFKRIAEKNGYFFKDIYNDDVYVRQAFGRYM